MFPLLARGGNGREFVGRARVWFCNTKGGEMGGMWKVEGKWEGGGHFQKAAVKLGWVWVELSVGCLPKCSLGGLRIGVEVGFRQC